MVLKIGDYNLGEKIVSLALSESAFQDLARNSLDTMVLQGNELFFWPEGRRVRIDEALAGRLALCHDYDVFQVNDRGEAFLYYDEGSLDNALILTTKCNSNCVMCPVPDGARRRECEITPESILEIIRHMPDDPAHLTITGGEPFLIQEKIFEILSALKRKMTGTEFLLLTNGRALAYETYVKMTRASSPANILFGIPLHGFDAATHDRITRAPGSFRQTCLGIQNLLYYGFSVELRIVVSKLNYDYIDQIAELITERFPTVESVKIMGLEMLGNAAKNVDQVWISYNQAFQSAKRAIDLLIAKGIDVALYNFPLCAVDVSYHTLCAKSITNYKIRYAAACEECELKDACGGIFAGTIRLAGDDIIPWRQR